MHITQQANTSAALAFRPAKKSTDADVVQYVHHLSKPVLKLTYIPVRCCKHTPIDSPLTQY